MTVALLLDRVLFALDLLPSSRAIEIAEQALQKGYDSPAILHLASLFETEVRWSDIQISFENVLAEVGVPLLTRFEAQPLLLKYLARQHSNKTISTRTLLDEVYKLAYETENGAADHPLLRIYLHELDYLDSMYSEAAIVNDLRRMLAWEKEVAKVCQQIQHEINGDL